MHDPLAEYRQLLTTPTKDSPVPEFWEAIQFELDLGSYELAAKYLHSLLVLRKPTEEELLALERKVGFATLLRLRNVPKWSDDPKAQKAAVADVETFLKQSAAAVRKLLDDPVRIKNTSRCCSGRRRNSSSRSRNSTCPGQRSSLPCSRS